MRTIVLDTNILIDNVHGFATWIDILREQPEHFLLVVPTIVVAEYLTAQEIEYEEEKQKAERYLTLFTKHDLTEDIAKTLGIILRRKTYAPSADLADLIVAATALHLHAELATRNRADFAKIPGLIFFEPEKGTS